MSPHEKHNRQPLDNVGGVAASEAGGNNTDDIKVVATPAMCFHCFDVLMDSFQKSSSSDHNNNSNKQPKKSTTNLNNKPPVFVNDLVDVSVECPLFVTWDKQQPPKNGNTHWQLRGCIGTLSPRLLVTSVEEYALISALNDRRFHPIAPSELPSLRVSVSLLVQYEPCQTVYDWTVGIHGILIKFQGENSDRHYSATYLPEVASEQQWDPPATIHSLILKAGYHGPVSPQLLQRIQCTRYQSSKCKITFDEYVTQHCQGDNPLLLLEQQAQQHGNPRPQSSSGTPCNNL